ncbi:Diacylglycerol kinase family enzyme [Desulfatibacillum alkenivorans DSM 16219]|jgi:diacylglycerol kinase (ATP)|uniref:diacylglycerol kinase (ATP) n=1 Tax=Desulfatibacillum alkenivorans DSM 16219 TaxID=1121393 RepID=A0A1M6SPN3_9BACT|nr:diacylglycerol kinase family protein [Desulfatibacillum alkenivorans]SHK46616.1 Diacylglycerol kinase family enzyme [Desulfatibacillum alkenivorans DSM 16219]
MKKFLFLVNPISGSSPGTIVASRIAHALKGRVPYSQYDIVFTEKDIAGQAKALAPHYEAVIGAGGDGTFGALVQAAAQTPNPPKIGVIPFGVGNDFARSLGVLEVLKHWGVPGMINMFLAGNTKMVDVLHVNGEHLFSSYLGIGNDAKISNTFNHFRPRTPRSVAGLRIGINKLLYTGFSLRNLAYTIPFAFEIRYRNSSGRETCVNAPVGLHGILVTNSAIYAGGAKVSSRADLSDGKFEVTVIKDIRHWWAMHLTRFFKMPLDELSPMVYQISTDWLKISLNGETFFQIDGEEPGPEITKAKSLEVKVSHQMEMFRP